MKRLRYEWISIFGKKKTDWMKKIGKWIDEFLLWKIKNEWMKKFWKKYLWMNECN